jgi:hypothetical protein
VGALLGEAAVKNQKKRKKNKLETLLVYTREIR